MHFYRFCNVLHSLLRKPPKDKVEKLRILRWPNIFLKKHSLLPSQCSLMSSAVEAAGCGENTITKLCSDRSTFIQSPFPPPHWQPSPAKQFVRILYNSSPFSPRSLLFFCLSFFKKPALLTSELFVRPGNMISLDCVKIESNFRGHFAFRVPVF